MKETTNRQILHTAMQMVYDEGCHEAKAVLMQNHEDTIQVRGGRVEKLQRAAPTSLALNLFIDGREGFFYTNDLAIDSLHRFVRQAVATTRMLEPDADRTLADSERYYRGGGPELKNYDATLSDIEPERKIRLATSHNTDASLSHPAIISAETHYSDRQHRAEYLISNGFEGSEASSYCTLTTIVTVEGRDGQHPMDGWGETRIFLDDMPTTGIADVALQRTLRKIGQRPTKSGTYTMLVESPVAGNLLQPLLSAMNGQALQQRMSFLEGRQHTQVGSTLLHLIDDPLQPGTRGACHFDYDGTATSRRTLFDEGRLQTYFIDTLYARKLHMAPTTQGTHHLILRPGDKSLNELMQAASNGILVTDFNGGNCDPSTGNFSYGIEGFVLRGGKLAEPVSGMNITGNMLELWQRLVGAANDADPWETELIPSLMFEGVHFAGN